MLITCAITAACGSNKQQNTDSAPTDSQSLTMVVGTYTQTDSYGLYSFKFDEMNGSYQLLDSIQTENPSYVIPSANGEQLYAVGELSNDSAFVAAFDFDKQSGKFTFLNQQFTHGEDPCYVLADSNFVVTANYTGGSISVFPLAAGGKLQAASQVVRFNGSGPNTERQAKAHLHCVYFSPDHRFLFANDLGSDAIHRFKVSKTRPYLERAEDIKLTPGAGPRHGVFSNDGKFLYIIDELDGNVNVFSYADNNLTPIQTIEADSLHAQGSADIRLSPNGKFLYASNRLQGDGIAVYARNIQTGHLKAIGYQPTDRHPRNFNITPNGNFLLVASRDDNNIEVFRIDQENGLLKKTNIKIPLSMPVCITWIP